MAFKGFFSKLGFKSSSSSSKLRKSHLKKKLDELLEVSLNLEALRERDNQQLLVQEQELESLRQQLSAKGEVCAHMTALCTNIRLQKSHIYSSVSIRKCSVHTSNFKYFCFSFQNGQEPPGDSASVQEQLRDALEKNLQRLVYDQQREVYIQSVLAYAAELAQQLAQAKRQQPKQGATSEATAGPEKEPQLSLGVQRDLEGQNAEVTRTQQELSAHRNQTVKAQAELQSQKEQVTRLQVELLVQQRKYEDKCSELSSFLRKHEEKSKELEEAKMQLQAERLGNRYKIKKKNKKKTNNVSRHAAELESMDIRLEEERKRSAELLLQVNMLQKSLLNRNGDERRIAALEQQIQISAKDFANEKNDRQSIQHQLHKVLKELHKTQDQISNLESAMQPNARSSEPSSYNNFERLTTDPGPTSPWKYVNLLETTFLECPYCQAQYPASRHRELLDHIDDCYDK
ncbi:centrosomal protein of 55 kDa-like [Parambassis ranga]|uniref:Centrosomal protein of 55 kDa-like n=1 Tax=Parambassis ranga TaxID=210632 RepID=A0A6P7HQT0_9TELE|nr:centrosomal protein of 55 kDa-like [Parambassis ranga]XP_028254331.1 centrosomal protein of 55 kDa-like [Parambassis ranga]